MSYEAGRPLPSSTSVNVRTTALSLTESTARSATVPGGGRRSTVTAAAPLRPWLVAVMVAEPGATPVTRPVGVTVATLVSLLVHVTVNPSLRACASPPEGEATLSVIVSPTETRIARGVTISGPAASVGARARQAIRAPDSPVATTSVTLPLEHALARFIESTSRSLNGPADTVGTTRETVQ